MRESWRRGRARPSRAGRARPRRAGAQQRRGLPQPQVEAVGQRRRGLGEGGRRVVPPPLPLRDVGAIDEGARELRLGGDDGIERARRAVEIAGANLRLRDEVGGFGVVRLALEQRIERAPRLGEVAFGEVEAAQRQRQRGVERPAGTRLLEVRDGVVGRRLRAGRRPAGLDAPFELGGDDRPEHPVRVGVVRIDGQRLPGRARRVLGAVGRALSVAISAGIAALLGSASAASR